DGNAPRESALVFAEQPRHADHDKVAGETDKAFHGSSHARLIASQALLTKSSAAPAVGASAIIRTIGSVLLPRTISHWSGQSTRSPSSRSLCASENCLSTASNAAASLSGANFAVRLMIS